VGEGGVEAPEVGIDISSGMSAKLGLNSTRSGHLHCCQVTYVHAQLCPREHRGGEKEN